MKRVVTIGGATQDLFLTCEDTQMLHLHTTEIEKSFLVLEEGHKLTVKDLIYRTGGGATNSAVSFARRGFNVSTICKIGNDAAGKRVIENLAQEKVNTDHIVVSPNHLTGTSCIIPCASGDRTVLVYRGANTTLDEKEFPFNALLGADQIYITSLNEHASLLLLPIAQFAKKHNIPVATNPGTSQLSAGADVLRAALPFIDVLILNSDEANRFMFSLLQKEQAPAENFTESTATPDLPELLRAPITYLDVCFSLTTFIAAVLAAGTKIVVVTNGSEGVYVGTKDGIYFHPSLHVPVQNTLGAGDAFGSGFVASLTEGRALEDAIRLGVLNSASVIQHTGAKEGLLSKQEIEHQLAAMDKSLLKKY